MLGRIFYLFTEIIINISLRATRRGQKAEKKISEQQLLFIHNIWTLA